MNSIVGLVALLAAVLGGYFFQSSKRRDDEALLENQKAKESLNPVDQELSKNQGQLESEEQKRKDTESEKPSTQDLLDFLNRPKS